MVFLLISRYLKYEFKIKLIFFILIILIPSFFIWGIGVGVYKWFPYFHLLEAKQVLIPNKNKDFGKITSFDMTYISIHSKSINIDSVLLKREKLIKKVFQSRK